MNLVNDRQMTWQRRIERAEELAKESPVLPELLDFYQQIARFQSTVVAGSMPANLEALLALIRRTAPDPMGQAARPGITWDDLLRSADPMHAFFARVLLQANTLQANTQQANGAGCARPSPAAAEVQPRCPFCGEKPVAAVLRPEGDGGKRSLLCGLCFTEWEYRRVLCPNCGEEDKDKLPVYTAEEFPHIRVEACDTCRVYLKAIDLTRNGRAVPEVDELASVVLDLWAAEHGYTKLQLNLFGM
jgi:FdhE protein